MNKKAYTLLITIILLTLFSFLSLNILETKSIKTQNLENQFLQIQAKNHLLFMKNYISKLNKDELDTIEHLEIKNENFIIEAYVELVNLEYNINIYVKSKYHTISLYKNFKIK